MMQPELEQATTRFQEHGTDLQATTAPLNVKYINKQKFESVNSSSFTNTLICSF